MAYRHRYSIPFTGNVIGDPIDYRVELWQRDGIDTAVVELDGAPSPFVLSLDSSDDPMALTRTSTARISFVDDIDVEDVLVTDGFEWLVRLVRVSDNAIIFSGYLTGEVLTQPYIDGANIVTLNAVSPMVSALASTMNIADRSSMTIGETLGQMLRLCNDVTEVWVPMIYTVSEKVSIANYTELLRARYSSTLYRSYVDDPMVTGEKYECSTYQSVIEDLCRLLGWSMVDIGDGKVYFTAAGYKGEYLRLQLSELEALSPFTPQRGVPSVFDFHAIEAVDTQDTVEIHQGYSSALVAVDAASSNDSFFNISGQVRKWVFETKNTTLRPVLEYGVGDEYQARSAIKIAQLSTGDVVLPQYMTRPTLIPNRAGASTLDWDVLPETAEEFRENVAGGLYIEYDSASLKDVAPDDGMAATKKEWSFASMMRIKEDAAFSDSLGNVCQYDLPSGTTLIKVVTPYRMFPKGAIVIDFEMRASVTEGFYITRDNRLGGGNINVSTEGYDIRFTQGYWGENKIVKATLKVGDYYWNGEQWGAESAVFDIPISVEEGEWHKVVSNKTVDMPYPGSSGLYIPISSSIMGSVELSIHSPLTNNPYHFDPSNISKRPTPYTDIKGFKIDYVPTYDLSDVPGLSSKYYKDFENSYIRKKEVSLKMHSSTNQASQHSTLFSEYGHAIDTLWRGNTADKPERFLLGDLERVFASPTRRWRRGLPLQTLRPADVWSKDAGKILMVTGASIDYAEGTGEIYLSDVKELKI